MASSQNLYENSTTRKTNTEINNNYETERLAQLTGFSFVNEDHLRTRENCDLEEKFQVGDDDLTRVCILRRARHLLRAIQGHLLIGVSMQS